MLLDNVCAVNIVVGLVCETAWAEVSCECVEVVFLTQVRLGHVTFFWIRGWNATIRSVGIFVYSELLSLSRPSHDSSSSNNDASAASNVPSRVLWSPKRLFLSILHPQSKC